MREIHVTVAAVIEHNGHFLLVEEHTEDGLRFNQPAGHLELGESLVQAVIRETLEESAHHFQPTALVGVYRWPHPTRDLMYLRFAFTGHVTGVEAQQALDTGIERAVWLAGDELHAALGQQRSPLVGQCIDDFLAGRRYALELLSDITG